MNDRFRVTLTPDRHEVEQARSDPRWPSFDILKPPAWVVRYAGFDMPREVFDAVRPQLAREGYAFDHMRNAWVRP